MMCQAAFFFFFTMLCCVLQGEGTSSPVALRARSRDSPSPSEDLPSPLTRGKRSTTRNRGQGDNSGADGTANLHPPPKRLCLSSVGGPVRTNFTADFTLCFLQFYYGTGLQVRKFTLIAYNTVQQLLYAVTLA